MIMEFMSTIRKLFYGIFSFPGIIALNIVIIIAAELSGEFFLDSGIIHAIALVFVVAAFVGVFTQYYIADPISQKFLRLSSVALLVFAASHVVEFLGYRVFDMEEDAIFANVVNFYCISILLIMAGIEVIASAHEKRSAFIRWAIRFCIALFAALIAVNIENDEFISLDPDSSALYLYGAGVALLYCVGLWRILSVKAITVLIVFVNYMNIGLALIVLSILPNMLYSVLEEGLKLSDYQIIYFAHFTFFAALSYMLVAFRKLGALKGIYAEVQAMFKR